MLQLLSICLDIHLCAWSGTLYTELILTTSETRHFRSLTTSNSTCYTTSIFSKNALETRSCQPSANAYSLVSLEYTHKTTISAQPTIPESVRIGWSVQTAVTSGWPVRTMTRRKTVRVVTRVWSVSTVTRGWPVGSVTRWWSVRAVTRWWSMKGLTSG